MTQTKVNPWNVQERSIIASIVNEALNLNLRQNHIVGCLTKKERNSCAVIWRVDGVSYNFWFALDWFRAEVQTKRVEIEVVSACAKHGMTIKDLTVNEYGQVYSVARKHEVVGNVGHTVNGWFVSCTRGSGRPQSVKSALGAVFSLFMMEVAV